MATKTSLKQFFQSKWNVIVVHLHMFFYSTICNYEFYYILYGSFAHQAGSWPMPAAAPSAKVTAEVTGATNLPKTNIYKYILNHIKCYFVKSSVYCMYSINVMCSVHGRTGL